MTRGEVDDEAIFSSIYQPLRRFAGVVGRFGDDPDDLVQEALVRTLAKGALASLEDPERYLRLVIIRLASNERRRAARADRAYSRLRRRPSLAASPDHSVDRLAVLPVRDRAVLYLSVIEGHDANGVARMLGMRPGAVRTAKSRALRRLRDAEEESRDE